MARRVIAIVTLVLLTSGLGAGALAARQGVDPSALVDRLVELEQGLPALPPEMPEDVVLSGDTTWADLTGDFVGTEVALEGLVEQARTLFIEADDVDGDAAQAVADAARSVLTFHQAYTHLAAWESHDLGLPVGTPTGTQASTFADELYGEAEVGLRLLMDAHARRLEAYRVLRDAEAASAEAKNHFDVQFRAERAFAGEVLPRVRRTLSEETTRLVAVTDRFRATGQQARAQSLTVVCLDREAYMADRGGNHELLTDPETDPEALAPLVGIPAAEECPSLPPDNAVQPAP